MEIQGSVVVVTGASLLVGHSYGGLVALEVARNNTAFTKLAVKALSTLPNPLL
jgi:surfactin synthase thioesterase subunit